MDAIQDQKMSKQATYSPVIEFIVRWMSFIGYVMIGLIGKFGYDIVSKKKITIPYILGTSAMALFVGFLTCKLCTAHPVVNESVAVPVATLLSRDMIVFLTMVDKKKLVEILLNIKSPSRDK